MGTGASPVAEDVRFSTAVAGQLSGDPHLAPDVGRSEPDVGRALAALCAELCAATAAREALVLVPAGPSSARILSRGGALESTNRVALPELALRELNLREVADAATLIIQHCARPLEVMRLGGADGLLGVLLVDRGSTSLSTADYRLAARQATTMASLLGIDAAWRRRDSEAHASRLTLATAIHDRVIQALFAVALQLSNVADLTVTDARRSSNAIQDALADLRSILDTSIAAASSSRPEAVPPATVASSRYAQAAGVTVDLPVDGIPQSRQDVYPSVLALVTEGVRNALKHADPENVRIGACLGQERLTVSVRNDGLRDDSGHPGIGLKLLALDAALAGGHVESGREEDTWLLTLTLPRTSGL